MSLINVLSSGLLLLDVAQGARVSGKHWFYGLFFVFILN